MNDTPYEILKKQFEIINAMPFSKRLELAFDLTDLSREIIRNRIKEREPDISESDLNVELFKTFYRFDFEEKELNAIAEHLRLYWIRQNTEKNKSGN